MRLVCAAQRVRSARVSVCARRRPPRTTAAIIVSFRSIDQSHEGRTWCDGRTILVLCIFTHTRCEGHRDSFHRSDSPVVHTRIRIRERNQFVLNHKRVNVCAVQFNSHILKYIEALTRIDDGISDACKVLILRYQPSIDHTAHMLHDRGEDSFVRSFVRSSVACRDMRPRQKFPSHPFSSTSCASFPRNQGLEKASRKVCILPDGGCRPPCLFM